ncbi:sugar phosphate isomerase/epimerase family protein [Candidatus Poribacteria bacterium]
MRFGFRTGGFRDWKIESVLEELARIGFDGAELCLESADMRPENFTQARADEIKKFMDGLGLEIASVSYHADAESGDQRRLNTFKSVEIAQWLGTDVLIINAERTREGEKEEQWQELVDRLKDLTAFAEKHGVNVAIEPEPLLIVDDINDMLRMIDDVGSPNLKVNLDVGHAYITDPDLPDSIRRLGDAIVHAHLEDIKDKVHSHLELGEGDIDFDAMHKAFEETGYSGFYVADLFRLGEDPSGVATRTLAALKERFS